MHGSMGGGWKRSHQRNRVSPRPDQTAPCSRWTTLGRPRGEVKAKVRGLMPRRMRLWPATLLIVFGNGGANRALTTSTAVTRQVRDDRVEVEFSDARAAFRQPATHR